MPEEAQRALLHGLSHELRAPLHALLGHLDLLRRGTFGALTPEQSQALDAVASSAERILAVTRDVLQVARIDAGQEQVIVGEVDLGELVAREIDAIRPLADRAGLALRARCPPGLKVVSDGHKIARILTNLLTNAIKYTRRGGVVVEGGAQGETVFVEVRDSGVGIPEEQQQAVFSEYVRVDRAGEGSGLGLPIARRLATLLGGRLVLRSAPGEGTTVRLELPESPKLAGRAG
jgi:signal transduction histidine kinase